MKTLTKKVLPNGLTIMTIPKKNALTATVFVLVETGSKYEEKNVNGISHFLEHMCFKGTKKRPTAAHISSELDALGASYNAFTSHEFTGYYAKVNPKHIENAVDVVSDIYLNQVFRPNEIAKESGVIVEEINMYEDDPKRKIHDNFMELLYGDQPAGWNIAGTREIVRSITKKDLEKYKNEHYVASATTVVVAGNIKEKEIQKLLEKKFSKISKSKKHSKKDVAEAQKKPEIQLEYRKTDQSHLILGVRTFPIADKRNAPLKVLSTILGEGMSSRLFHIIRNKLGAAYYVSSFTDLYTDHGYLGVAVGCDTKKAEQVTKAIISEFKKLKKTPVTKEELAKAKNYLIGRTSIGLETTDELAWFFAGQYALERKTKTPKEIIKEIEVVTAKDVQAVAKEIFKNEGLNLSYIGPIKKKDVFVPLLRL